MSLLDRLRYAKDRVIWDAVFCVLDSARDNAEPFLAHFFNGALGGVYVTLKVLLDLPLELSFLRRKKRQLETGDVDGLIRVITAYFAYSFAENEGNKHVLEELGLDKDGFVRAVEGHMRMPQSETELVKELRAYRTQDLGRHYVHLGVVVYRLLNPAEPKGYPTPQEGIAVGQACLSGFEALMQSLRETLNGEGTRY